MNPVIRRILPFIFLVVTSLSWGIYYTTTTHFNNSGEANYEWLFLIDGLFVLPLLCFVCIKDKKQALVKAVVYVSLAILVGSFIIPDESKVIWEYLESGRYVLLIGFVLLEVMAIVTMFMAIKVALSKQEDPDLAIVSAVQKYVGKGALCKILTFETRMWMFLFCANSISFKHFHGSQHFSYHLKDGSQSTALGFIPRFSQ
ncbi:hypothetical protein [Microbulbifer sp. THAF38]|uniref:hypothetical protein n=1 Tax=Microbulbifer sp. THAF38 TaxID=2587856 RepID=UPI0012696C61|nr:hypothetical protein [Microbulbifer sp. THAF38]QFT54792.1 hypothetical protein FIU95_09525 [Microbulbifer sp. THAF38]